MKGVAAGIDHAGGGTRTAGFVLLLGVFAAACSGSSTPPSPTPTTIPTAAIAATPTVDPSQEAAIALGEVAASLYQGARTAVAGTGGSARYVGDGLTTYMNLSVSIAADAAVFRDFQYVLKCDSPTPPTMCTVIRAFDPAKVQKIKDLLPRLGITTGVELEVDGKADPVWNDPRKPITYEGSCGEGICVTGTGATITLGPGIPVNSNQVLACLRALCTQVHTGINSPVVNLKLRGIVGDRASVASERRSEITLRIDLPKQYRMLVWDTFLRLVGHK